MTKLLDLPDELLLNNILKHLTAADLWRLGAVCHKLNEKDPEKNVVQHELQQRDSALILSRQYPPESAIMSVFDYRERVFCFEHCRTFAWEMTRLAQRHETFGFPCTEPDCKYPNLHSRILRLRNGLRNGKNYFFFALFTSRDKVLWQGFLQDYDPESDFTNPMDGLDPYSSALGTELGNLWSDFHFNFVKKSDVQFHLDAGNISNLTIDHADSDLHVTLVCLIHSQEQPELLPEVRLHYSSRGFQTQYRQTSSYHAPVSIDILCDQYVTPHYGMNGDYATPFFIWKSRTCLHSFSMLYNFENIRYDDDDEVDIDGDDGNDDEVDTDDDDEMDADDMYDEDVDGDYDQIMDDGEDYLDEDEIDD